MSATYFKLTPRQSGPLGSIKMGSRARRHMYDSVKFDDSDSPPSVSESGDSQLPTWKTYRKYNPLFIFLAWLFQNLVI